jgi:hypothetical protein
MGTGKALQFAVAPVKECRVLLVAAKDDVLPVDSDQKFQDLHVVLVLRNRYGKCMGFAVMVFSFFEAGVHVFLAVHSRQIFASWGIQTPLYAPGLVTVLVLWLPLGVVHLVFFVRHGISFREILGGILLLVVLSLLLVQLPEALFKRPDTPFGWTDQGFYDAYLKS